jgi:predicted RNase H-like HicB family nuclease
VREYVALIRQGPDGIYYDVTFPDLPSVRAAGRTLERARAKAEVALFRHIRRLVAEGQTIPEPLSLEAIEATLGIRECSKPRPSRGSKLIVATTMLPDLESTARAKP